MSNGIATCYILVVSSFKKIHPVPVPISQNRVSNADIESMESNRSSPDVISTLAAYGAPLLVAVLLLIRVASGQWASVAFMALTFLAVLAFYLFAFAGDDSDDAESEVESMPEDS